MSQRQIFDHCATPYLFIAPQILICCVFFFWPAFEAIYSSTQLEDPWGLSSTFVGLENYVELFHTPEYIDTLGYTIVFSLTVAFFSLGIALLLAVKADKVLRGQSQYKVGLTWVYAVAPAVAGMVASFMFNQHFGLLHEFLNRLWSFNPTLNGFDAQMMVAVVCIWKQVSVNFVFFLAGLQGIPKAITEAGMMDCQSRSRRFWTLTFPLLAPTSFFLMVINITYAFFDTFGVIDTLTQGAPANQTMTLVYKVYRDGFIGADLGSSSAQSVILMIFVALLTLVQFRFVEKKIHY
jgi:sn-glycerol 3-phosphate transport system permease protein